MLKKTLIKALLASAAFVVASQAQAAVVAIYGNYYPSGQNIAKYITNFLTAQGHSVIYNKKQTPTTADLAGVEAVINLRDGLMGTGKGSQDIVDFVNNGGLFITEFSTAAWATSAGLLKGINENKGLGTDGQNIDFTEKASKFNMTDNIGDSFIDPTRTNSTWHIDTTGTDVDVYATTSTSDGLLKDLPVIFGNSYGKGYVLANLWAWADKAQTANFSLTWLHNVLGNIGNFKPDPSPVPEPILFGLLGMGLGLIALRSRRRTVA